MLIYVGTVFSEEWRYVILCLCKRNLYSERNLLQMPSAVRDLFAVGIRFNIFFVQSSPDTLCVVHSGLVCKAEGPFFFFLLHFSTLAGDAYNKPRL